MNKDNELSLLDIKVLKFINSHNGKSYNEIENKFRELSDKCIQSLLDKCYIEYEKKEKKLNNPLFGDDSIYWGIFKINNEGKYFLKNKKITFITSTFERVAIAIGSAIITAIVTLLFA